MYGFWRARHAKESWLHVILWSKFFFKLKMLCQIKKLTILLGGDGFKLHNMVADKFVLTAWGEFCGPHNSPYALLVPKLQPFCGMVSFMFSIKLQFFIIYWSKLPYIKGKTILLKKYIFRLFTFMVIFFLQKLENWAAGNNC